MGHTDWLDRIWILWIYISFLKNIYLFSWIFLGVYTFISRFWLTRGCNHLGIFFCEQHTVVVLFVVDFSLWYGILFTTLVVFSKWILFLWMKCVVSFFLVLLMVSLILNLFNYLSKNPWILWILLLQFFISLKFDVDKWIRLHINWWDAVLTG